MAPTETDDDAAEWVRRRKSVDMIVALSTAGWTISIIAIAIAIAIAVSIERRQRR
jgi:hypothetical protein